MKRRSKILLWVVFCVFALMALLLSDWLGVFVIAHRYLSGGTQGGLSFSFSRCGDDGGAITDTVKSQEWKAGTLVLNGVAFPNCAATWLFGGYEVAGDKLSLTYSAVQFGAMACVCPMEVRYEIEGLPAKEYKVSVSEGPLIEYRPLTYGLFME